MSNLDPSLESLLTSYLDGAVSEEERARVENLLTSDPSAAADLRGLTELGEELRALDASQSYSLPVGFADRVIESAVERARVEGCEESHPLSRLASQPTTRVKLASTRTVALGGIAATVAASIALAVVFYPADMDPDPLSLANQETIKSESPDSGPLMASKLDVMDPSPLESVASPSLEKQEAAELSESMVASERPITSGLSATSERSGQTTNLDGPPERSGEPVIAGMSTETASKDSFVGATRPNQDDNQSLRPVLVLDIRLVNSGVGVSPIREAMQKARLQQESEQDIDGAIVSAVGSSLDDGALSGSLMYLRAPAKQLDRFIMNLLEDRRQIASVGLGLATDAPVIGTANDLSKVDPTTVRHDFSELVDDQRSADLLESLDDNTYQPMDTETAALMGNAVLANPSDGPDVMANVFLLVR
ncbi:MAG: hypothetical protein AAF989_00385 [Planctomycetota bacterium]